MTNLTEKRNRKPAGGLIALLSVLAAFTAGYAGTDFTTNGTSDLAIFTPSTATWNVPDAGLSEDWGWNETHPVPGDFDGDQSTDLAVYYRQAGTWYIRNQSGGVLAWGLNWGYRNAHAVGFGDYNNDDADDLALFDPFTARWFIRTLAGDVLAWNLAWGVSYFQPVPGDYDGDGTTDLGMYDRINGRWYIYSLNKGLIAWALPWGFSSARPVPGDFDGDGRHDLAVYHRQAGRWYIRTVSGTVLAWAKPWGFASARSVPGDYDGDGQDDLAVYYAPDGAWYVLSLLGDTILYYGAPLGNADTVPIGMYAHGGEGQVVVAHGDSLTYGRGSSSNGPDTSYPAFLDNRLETALGGLSYIINSGVPGETTPKGRGRLPGVLSTYRATLLLLMEGTNDLFFQYTDGSILNNLTAMANTAKGQGASVVMATLPPIASRPFDNRDAQHARVIAINPSIRSLAGSLGWTYAETYNSITSQSNWQNTLYKTTESLHPNDAGYKVFRDEFIKAIRSAVNNGSFIY